MIQLMLPFIAGHIQGEIVAVGMGNHFSSLRAVQTRGGAAFVALLLALSALGIAGLAASAYLAAGELPDGWLPQAVLGALGPHAEALSTASFFAGFAPYCLLGLALLPRAMSRALAPIDILALVTTVLAGLAGNEAGALVAHMCGSYAVGVASGVVRTMCPRISRMDGWFGHSLRM
ncbi:MAG: hypothetical protein OXU25_01465 [Thaumarchaeota archaeon]|nr:hypothetical protein [Nitrososphaerota archaeon]